MTTEEQIWTLLKNKQLSDIAVAGIMGNLFAESSLKFNNLQDTTEKRLGSDIYYTHAIDSGSYPRQSFINDNAGYGIAQWTTDSRKAGLYDLCKSKGKSIADPQCQIDFLYNELQSRNLINKLNNSTSIQEASDIFLIWFEAPANQSQSVKNIRASFGQNYYNKLKDIKIEQTTQGGSVMKYSTSNPPLKCFMTNSTCYRETRKMDIKGVLVHSTGANNPNLKRYVQPSRDDANYVTLMQKLGTNIAGNDWNHIELQAGLNAWIGKLENGQVTSVQTMPWEYRPWGCGSGSTGSCNDGWIQYEICEDNLTDSGYFNKIYKEACELTAYLCKLYNLNPRGTVNFKGRNVPVILCHQDSARLGLGSNHADVYHWFSRFGKDMDDFRSDVAKLLSENSSEVAPSPSSPSSGGNQSNINLPPLVYTRLLKRGKDGEDVRKLQEALIKLGYSCGSYGADGDFGAGTEAAVIAFQQKNNLDDDGEAGPMTIAKINELLTNSGSSSNTPSPSPTPSSGGSSGGNSQSSSITTPTTGLFRVRKSWTDMRSQIGAFSNLNNAKNACDNAGPGYYVFDSSGNAVYAYAGGSTSGSGSSNNTPVTPAKTYSGVMLGYAAKDERGSYSGGSAGDQTGKEVYVNGWYDQSWTEVLRPVDPQLAENIARQCENACANNNIGYSQSDRNTLLTQAKRAGYDMSKITTPCNCDCSSFVSAVCVCCGLPEATFFPGGNGCVTSTIGPACLSTGKFRQFTDSKYTKQKDYLKRGDILCNRNAHVVIVLSDGSRA